MDTLSALSDGFATALTAANLLWALVGVTLGTAVNMMPGIGPALTISGTAAPRNACRCRPPPRSSCSRESTTADGTVD